MSPLEVLLALGDEPVVVVALLPLHLHVEDLVEVLPDLVDLLLVLGLLALEVVDG